MASKNGANQHRLGVRSPWAFVELEPRLLLAGDMGAALSVSATACATDANIAATESQTQQEATTPLAIVFIDSRVDDIDALESGLIEGTELVLIDSKRDALEQISLHLQHRQNVASLHLVSHAASGQLLLGNQMINQAALIARSSEVQQWSAALSDEADILVYGCDAGAGREGASFAIRLAKITGADVAMSTDKTGSANTIESVQADWDFERHVGPIESPVAFNAVTQRQYASTLGLSQTTNDDIPAFVPVLEKSLGDVIGVESAEAVAADDTIVQSETSALDLAVVAPIIVNDSNEIANDAEPIIEPIIEPIFEQSDVEEIPIELADATQLPLDGDSLRESFTQDALAVETATATVAATESTGVAVAITQPIVAPSTLVTPVTNMPVAPAADSLVTPVAVAPATPTPAAPIASTEAPISPVPATPIRNTIATTSVQTPATVVRVESSPLIDLNNRLSALTNSSRNLGVVPTIASSVTETTPSRVSCHSVLVGRAAECEKATANAAKTNEILTTVTPALRIEIHQSETVVKTPVTTKESAALRPSKNIDDDKSGRCIRSASKAVELHTGEPQLDADETIEEMVEDEMTLIATETKTPPTDSIGQSREISVGGSWAAWANGASQRHVVSAATTLHQTEIDRANFHSKLQGGTSSSFRQHSGTTVSVADTPSPEQTGNDGQKLNDQFGMQGSAKTSAENVNLNSVNTLREGLSVATIGQSGDYDLEVTQASCEQMVFENTADSSVRWLDAVTELHQLAWKQESAGNDGSIGTLAYLNPISRYSGE
ncbi:MAG: DUF4347 domain-containing protein [Pirellulaceae bacterium]